MNYGINVESWECISILPSAGPICQLVRATLHLDGHTESGEKTDHLLVIDGKFSPLSITTNHTVHKISFCFKCFYHLHKRQLREHNQCNSHLM